jgi:hypothetical protein
MGSRAAAVSTAFSGMPTTMMPFLYQTRTITSLHMKRSIPRNRIRFTYAIIRKNFSCISQRLVDSTSGTNDNRGGNGGPVIRRTINVHGTEPQPDTRWQADTEPRNAKFNAGSHGGNGRLKTATTTNIHGTAPQPDVRWEFDLERSTTHVKSADIPWASAVDNGGRERNDFTGDRWEDIDGDEEMDHMKFSKRNSIDFEEDADNEFAESSQLNDIAELTDPRKARESTITVSERYAFQKIFSDIFVRSQQAGTGHVFNEEHEEAVKKHPQPRKAKAKLNHIMGEALKVSGTPQTREEKQIAVGRYPPALRAAAARAIGLYEMDSRLEDEATDGEVGLNTDQLEQLREPERARVEGLMKAATTDFELWDIMENEVFSLIAKLRLGDSPKKEVRKKKNGAKKSKKDVHVSDSGKSVPQSESSITFSTTESGISPLALYGPLYPSYVLLGLRLLDRSFAKPSPLALSVLPQIKSLGLISHVLGASTQLYNELLQIYRYRQDDYRGVHNLLTEMEHFGLEFDEETYEIVVDIMRKQMAILRGDKGSALRVLWNLPEFAPHRFRAWRDKIKYAIREKDTNINRQLVA